MFGESRSIGSSVIAALLVVVLVAQPIAPIVGSAAATSTSTDDATTAPSIEDGPRVYDATFDLNDTNVSDNPCEEPDYLSAMEDFSNLWAPGMADLLDDDMDCEVYRGIQQETKAEIYADLKQTKRSQEITRVLEENNEAALRDNVWIRVEARTAELIRQNATRTEALENVSYLVNKSYASLQANHLEATEKILMDVSRSVYSQALHGLDGRVEFYNIPGSTWGAFTYGPDPDSTNLSSALEANGYYNVQLVDGTNHSMRVFNHPDHHDILYGADGWSYYWNVEGSSMNKINMYVKHPTKGTTTGPSDHDIVYNVTSRSQSWNDIQSEHSYMLGEARTFVNNVYNNSEQPPEDVNWSDVLSAASLEEYSTDQDTTGSHALSRAALSFLGISGNLNASMTIKWDPADGHTYPGTPIKPVDVGHATVSNISLGDESIITGDEIMTADIDPDDGSTVIGSRLMLTTENGSSFEITGRDYDNDGRWRFSLANDSIRNLYNQTTDTKSVDMSASIKVLYEEEIAQATESWLMTYDPEGTVNRELYGALYTDWGPNATEGDFITGYVYNVSNADSIVYWIDDRPDGEARRFELDGEFVITRMQNPRTGETFNETTLHDSRTQATVNTTYWNQTELQMWEDYQVDWSETFDDSSGGGTISLGDYDLGGALPDLGETTWGIIVIVIGAFLILLGLVTR